jgi:hypothetical protein
MNFPTVGLIRGILFFNLIFNAWPGVMDLWKKLYAQCWMHNALTDWLAYQYPQHYVEIARRMAEWMVGWMDGWMDGITGLWAAHESHTPGRTLRWSAAVLVQYKRHRSVDCVGAKSFVCPLHVVQLWPHMALWTLYIRNLNIVCCTGLETKQRNNALLFALLTPQNPLFFDYIFHCLLPMKLFFWDE